MAPGLFSRLGTKSPHGKGLSESDALRGRTPSPNPPRSRKVSTNDPADAPEFPKLTLTNDNDETSSIASPMIVGYGHHQRYDSTPGGTPSLEERRKAGVERRALSVSAGNSPRIDDESHYTARQSHIGLGHPTTPPKAASVNGAMSAVPTPAPRSRGASPARSLTAKSSKGTISTGGGEKYEDDMPSTLPPLPPLPPIPSSNLPPNRHQTMSSFHHARRDSTASAGSTEENTVLYQPMRSLTESPTALRHGDRNGLAPANHDTDAVSVRSGVTDATGGSAKKKKTWRKTSNPKSMGLAGAIAASGLAMANPVVTQQRLPPGPPSNVASPQPRQAASASDVLLSSSLGSKASLPRSQRSRPPSPQPVNGNVVHEADDVDSPFTDDDDDTGSEGLDLDDDDIPVTGFAVASYKRNMDFHALFPAVPEGDYLIEDYGCALQREILIQGRIYISENHICFHANIFGWTTDLIVPMHDVTSLEKKMTAFVIPNAVQISTRSTVYTFASFMSRDTTFDVIHNIWRLARPDDATSLGSGMSPRGSLDDTTALGQVEGGGAGAGRKQRKATQCTCMKEGKHFSETAMDCIVPGSPEKAWTLIFASAFVKDFLRTDQKLIDIQMADWEQIGGDKDVRLLTRNMSYIKPLSGAVGPKQTKCELRDEMLYCNFDDHVTTQTTTRTPDVPSGGAFAVKTKTCIMWASAATTRILVTTEVEWTGRSFIKSLIEKSCIEGQKTYHADLERGMRAYIAENRAEFLQGLDIEAETATQLVETPLSPTAAAAGQTLMLSETEIRKEREKERNTRAMQWAYDTFEGAYKVGKQSANGAIELIKDAWEHSSSTTILIFLIVGLVFSNVYTLTRVGKTEKVGRVREKKVAVVGREPEHEKWVQGIVTALWDELSASKDALGKGAEQPRSVPVPGGAGDLLAEAHHIAQMLDAIEERVTGLKTGLRALTAPVGDAPSQGRVTKDEI